MSLICKEDLIAEYDRVHQGPPGGARKLMVDAPEIDAVEIVRCENCIHRGIPIKCPMCYEALVDVWNDDEHDVDFIKRDFSTDNGFCDNGEDKNGRCLY